MSTAARASLRAFLLVLGFHRIAGSPPGTAAVAVFWRYNPESAPEVTGGCGARPPPTPEITGVSGLGRLALGRRIRGRKKSVDPCLPRRRFARGDGSCLRAVKIETNRKADLAAHHDGEKMRDARG